MPSAVSGRFAAAKIAGSQKSHPIGGYSRGLGSRRIVLTAQPELGSSVRLGRYMDAFEPEGGGATLANIAAGWAGARFAVGRPSSVSHSHLRRHQELGQYDAPYHSTRSRRGIRADSDGVTTCSNFRCGRSRADRCLTVVRTIGFFICKHTASTQPWRPGYANRENQ
jgi:hypothetical protein